MKFRKLFVYGLVLVFVALVFVAALEVKKSEILIRTKPYQNLTLKFVDVEGENVLQIYSNRSRKFGELRWAFYSVAEDFKLFITDDDTAGVDPVEYGPYVSGNPVEINFSGWSAGSNSAAPASPPNVGASGSSSGSVSGVSDSNGSSGQNSGNSPLTGLVVDGEGTSSNTSYFVAIGAFALAMAALVVRRLLRNRMTAPAQPSPANFDKVEKISPSVQEAKKIVRRPALNVRQQKATGDTEKRIADLQKQLNELKNQERLVDLQKQIAREKEALRKMQDASEPVGESQNQNNNSGRNLKNNWNDSQF